MAQISEKLRTLAGTTDEAALRDASRVLGDAITTGNISNSTGVAIGRNIRHVINQFNVPPKATAVLLDLRALLGTLSGDSHVLRGGSWRSEARGVRSSARYGFFDLRNLDGGFRVVRSVFPGR